MDGWTDGWTDGQIDGRTYGICPMCSTGHCLLLALLSCLHLAFALRLFAGQGFRRTLDAFGRLVFPFIPSSRGFVGIFEARGKSGRS